MILLTVAEKNRDVQDGCKEGRKNWGMDEGRVKQNNWQMMGAVSDRSKRGKTIEEDMEEKKVGKNRWTGEDDNRE